MIVVCMATCEPREDLLAAQVTSLRGQRGVAWTAVVDDDASPPGALRALATDGRFDVRVNADRVGAYRNFERCLARVPPGVEAVAPCDQDDVWHPDKLATLLEALRCPGVTLAYSDLRIVRAGGRILSETYWTNRDNGWDDLAAELHTNVVTGAGSLLRREVLDYALPFPEEIAGASFHDHWLACVALALGDLAYVARPLVDYVQHAGNVTGHGGRRRPGEPSSGDPWRERAARDYERHVRRPRLMARALLERCSGRMTPEKRRAAERAATAGEGLAGVARVLAGAAGEQLAPRRTLEARRRAARGVLWRQLARSSTSR